MTFDDHYYAALCDVLVRDVRAAASRDWDGYYSNPVSAAVVRARNTMREARRLGLYPSTAQLEAETRKAA